MSSWPSSPAGYAKALAALGTACLVLVVAVLLDLGVVTTAGIEAAAVAVGVLLAPANRTPPGP